MCEVCWLEKDLVSLLNVFLVLFDVVSNELFKGLGYYGIFAYFFLEKTHILIPFLVLIIIKVMSFYRIGYIGYIPESESPESVLVLSYVCDKIKQKGIIDIPFFRAIYLLNIKTKEAYFSNATFIYTENCKINYIDTNMVSFLKIKNSTINTIEGNENIEILNIQYSKVGKIINCPNLYSFFKKEVSIVDFSPNCEILRRLSSIRNLIRYNNKQNEEMKGREKAGKKLLAWFQRLKYIRRIRNYLSEETIHEYYKPGGKSFQRSRNRFERAKESFNRLNS